MPVSDQMWAQIVALTVGHDDPAIMSDMSANRGRPTVTGTNIPVVRVLMAMDDGDYEGLKAEYPEFTGDMVRAVHQGLIRMFSA